MDQRARYNHILDDVIDSLKLTQSFGVDYVELGPKPALEILFKGVAECTLCALHERRLSTAKINRGLGGLRAEIAFVIENELPEKSEESELLAKMITAGMGLKLEDLYITSAVKCVVKEPDPDNKEALNACKDYLLRELEYVSPSVVVTLGQGATGALIDSPLPFTSLRGRFQNIASPVVKSSIAVFQVMPTHPLNILIGNLELKKESWSDLKKIMYKLGL